MSISKKNKYTFNYLISVNNTNRGCAQISTVLTIMYKPCHCPTHTYVFEWNIFRNVFILVFILLLTPPDLSNLSTRICGPLEGERDFEPKKGIFYLMTVSQNLIFFLWMGFMQKIDATLLKMCRHMCNLIFSKWSGSIFWVNGVSRQDSRKLWSDRV